MNEQRDLNETDLSSIAGGRTIISMEERVENKYSLEVRDPRRGGAGNTRSDETPNTGGETEFYQQP